MTVIGCSRHSLSNVNALKQAALCTMHLGCAAVRHGAQRGRAQPRRSCRAGGMHACVASSGASRLNRRGCAAAQVVDGEILDRARAEDGRDGSTGLVVVRAGARAPPLPRRPGLPGHGFSPPPGRPRPSAGSPGRQVANPAVVARQLHCAARTLWPPVRLTEDGVPALAGKAAARGGRAGGPSASGPGGLGSTLTLTWYGEGGRRRPVGGARGRQPRGARARRARGAAHGGPQALPAGGAAARGGQRRPCAAGPRAALLVAGPPCARWQRSHHARDGARAGRVLCDAAVMHAGGTDTRSDKDGARSSGWRSLAHTKGGTTAGRGARAPGAEAAARAAWGSRQRGGHAWLSLAEPAAACAQARHLRAQGRQAGQRASRQPLLRRPGL
jgi:hypothetical protein